LNVNFCFIFSLFIGAPKGQTHVAEGNGKTWGTVFRCQWKKDAPCQRFDKIDSFGKT